MNHLLHAFDKWFGSSIGVWQTFLIILVVVVIELLLFPALDLHGFWLLYWLTIYSAVTQPVLAYSNRRSVREAEDKDRLILELEQRILDSEERILAELRKGGEQDVG